MERELMMGIIIPKEMEEDFRLFTVLHGGSIELCEPFERMTNERKIALFDKITEELQKSEV